MKIKTFLAFSILICIFHDVTFSYNNDTDDIKKIISDIDQLLQKTKTEIKHLSEITTDCDKKGKWQIGNVINPTKGSQVLSTAQVFLDDNNIRCCISKKQAARKIGVVNQIIITDQMGH